MKFLILGHGRHGKDTAAHMLMNITGGFFLSSSDAANHHAVYPRLKEKYGYESEQECFEDRVNHREEWRDLILAYNTPDRTRLAREIIRHADCYVGMRSLEEFNACVRKRMFDHVLWIDRSAHLPDDPSMEIPYDDRMYLINNNGSVEDMREEIQQFAFMHQLMHANLESRNAARR